MARSGVGTSTGPAQGHPVRRVDMFTGTDGNVSMDVYVEGRRPVTFKIDAMTDEGKIILLGLAQQCASAIEHAMDRDRIKEERRARKGER